MKKRGQIPALFSLLILLSFRRLIYNSEELTARGGVA